MDFKSLSDGNQDPTGSGMVSENHGTSPGTMHDFQTFFLLLSSEVSLSVLNVAEFFTLALYSIRILPNGVVKGIQYPAFIGPHFLVLVC